jgi:hypothetical protein
MATPRVGRRKKWKLTLVKAKRVTLLKKVNDPNDKDDPRWVTRRLAAFEAVIAKKEKSKAQKQRDKKPGPARRPKRTPDL